MLDISRVVNSALIWNVCLFFLFMPNVGKEYYLNVKQLNLHLPLE
jgi:hypothetical protein